MKQYNTVANPALELRDGGARRRRGGGEGGRGGGALHAPLPFLPSLISSSLPRGRKEGGGEEGGRKVGFTGPSDGHQICNTVTQWINFSFSSVK